jgi:hypothetical protein
MNRQHHRIGSAIALTLALGATLAPSAWADPAPLAKAEAAIAAQSQAGVAVRANPDQQIAGTRPNSPPSPRPVKVVFPNPDQQAPAVTPVDYASPKVPATIVRVITPSGGFDWGDAAIGAAAGFMLTVVGLGGVAAIARRRTRRGEPAMAS